MKGSASLESFNMFIDYPDMMWVTPVWPAHVPEQLPHHNLSVFLQRGPGHSVSVVEQTNDGEPRAQSMMLVSHVWPELKPLVSHLR
jgi:hypothetical protein